MRILARTDELPVDFRRWVARFPNENGAAAPSAPASHDHDDLYYTQAQVDALLAALPGVAAGFDVTDGSGLATVTHGLGDTPDGIALAVGESDTIEYGAVGATTFEVITGSAGTAFGWVAVLGSGGGGGSLSWDDITGKPSTFPPSTHTHDDRYYTETEADALLAALEALVSETVRPPTGAGLTLRDDFNRANGDPGANWTLVAGAKPTINTNQLARGSGAGDMVWATALSGPHTVRVDLAVEPTVDNDYHYLYLLDDDTADFASVNGYCVEFDNDYWDLFRIDSGSFVRIDAWSQVHDTGYFQNGDGIELGLRGNDVVFFRRRGGLWQELGRKADDTHRPSTMFRGIGFGTGTTVRIDNFYG